MQKPIPYNNTGILQLLQSPDKKNIELGFQLCVGQQTNYSPIMATELQKQALLCIRYNLETAFWQNLTELNLTHCQLETLPPELGKLTPLQSLWLWQNKLGSVPPEIGELTNLQVLSLQYNQLTRLPPDISKLTKLRDLYLYGNKISKEEKRNIVRRLPPEYDIRFKRFEDQHNA